MKKTLLFTLALILIAGLNLNVSAQAHLKADPTNIVWVSFDALDNDGNPINEAAAITYNSLVTDSVFNEGGTRATLEPGKYGNAATFTEDNQAFFIHYDSAMDCKSNAFTLAAWINLDTIMNWRGILAWGTNADDRAPWAMQTWSDGALRLAVNWGGGPSPQNSDPGVLIQKTWQHTAITWDGIEAIFYVDGKQVGSWIATDLIEVITDYEEAIAVGCDYGGGDEYVVGQIDECRAFNRTFTVEEIDTLMNQIGRSTDINKHITNADYKVFFNPVSQNLKISSSLGFNSVYVYDITGKIMRSSQSFNQRTLDVNMSGIKTGVYIVRIDNMYFEKILIE